MTRRTRIDLGRSNPHPPAPIKQDTQTAVGAARLPSTAKPWHGRAQRTLRRRYGRDRATVGPCRTRQARYAFYRVTGALWGPQPSP